ncbi:hypothetical protein EVAR_93761_1 [Eumeta japonica]|uniref:Uncharacterized protein n=1 Tax=Eumeta variegata TaxID=151549 RepID=A0A4C1VC14_EUMVA|nr:hypothetical protein EVAR_93761_1 [Eumeta japonica]
MFRKEKSFLYGESHVLGAARLRLTTFTCLGKVGKASRKGGRIRTNLKCPHTGGRVEGFAEVLILIDTKLPRTGPKGSAPSSDENPCGFDRSVRDHVEHKRFRHFGAPVGPEAPGPCLGCPYGREGTDCISKDVDVTSNDLRASRRGRLRAISDFRIGNGAICSSKLVEYDFLRTRDPAGWILRLRNVLAAVFQNGQTNDYRDTETSPVQLAASDGTPTKLPVDGRRP